MIERRSFSTGQLFGIKARDTSVRTGVKIACLGTFNLDRKEFNVNFVSSEGVGNRYQTLKFETREQAEEWIRSNYLIYGYQEDDLAVTRTIGTNTYQKVPVLGSDVPGWVNVIKFDTYTSARVLDRMKAACPEYFSEDAPGPANTMHYRGFHF